MQDQDDKVPEVEKKENPPGQEDIELDYEPMSSDHNTLSDEEVDEPEPETGASDPNPGEYVVKYKIFFEGSEFKTRVSSVFLLMMVHDDAILNTLVILFQWEFASDDQEVKAFCEQVLKKANNVNIIDVRVDRQKPGEKPYKNIDLEGTTFGDFEDLSKDDLFIIHTGSM